MEQTDLIELIKEKELIEALNKFIYGVRKDMKERYGEFNFTIKVDIALMAKEENYDKLKKYAPTLQHILNSITGPVQQ